MTGSRPTSLPHPRGRGDGKLAVEACCDMETSRGPSREGQSWATRKTGTSTVREGNVMSRQQRPSSTGHAKRIHDYVRSSFARNCGQYGRLAGHDAEDVLQAVLLELHEKFGDDPATWGDWSAVVHPAVETATKRALDKLRQTARKRRQRGHGREVPLSEKLDGNSRLSVKETPTLDLALDVQAALSRLGDRQQRAFAMRTDGVPVHKIAHLLGVTERTISEDLTKAYAAIEAVLAEYRS